MNITKAQQGRANKHLDKLTRVDGKLMTNREFAHYLKDKGYTSEIGKDRDYDKEEKERAALDRLIRGWHIPTGNENHPATIAYNKRKEALKAGIYREYFMLVQPEGSHAGFYEVSKTVWDYFNTL